MINREFKFSATDLLALLRQLEWVRSVTYSDYGDVECKICEAEFPEAATTKTHAAGCALDTMIEGLKRLLEPLGNSKVVSYKWLPGHLESCGACYGNACDCAAQGRVG